MRTPHPNNNEVRAWAIKNGWDLGDRGRIPADVIDAWDRRHPKRKYVAEEANHGTIQGRVRNGCKCRYCVAAFARYQVRFYTQVLEDLAA